jgi:hypothetical protein
MIGIDFQNGKLAEMAKKSVSAGMSLSAIVEQQWYGGKNFMCGFKDRLGHLLARKLSHDA